MSLSGSFDSVLDTLQNKSLIGFPLLYWSAGGFVIILLCCCIICCVCCRKRYKKKRRESAERHLRSTEEMTTVTVAQRKSLADDHQGNKNDKRFMKRDSYQAYDLYHTQQKQKQMERANQQPPGSYVPQRPSSPPNGPHVHNQRQQQYHDNQMNANQRNQNQYGNNSNPEYNKNNQKQYRNDNHNNYNNANQGYQPNQDRSQYGNAGNNPSSYPNNSSLNQNSSNMMYNPNPKVNPYENNTNPHNYNQNTHNNANPYGNNPDANRYENQSHNQQAHNDRNVEQDNEDMNDKYAATGFQLPSSIYSNPTGRPPPEVRGSQSNAPNNGRSQSPPPQQSYNGNLGVSHDPNEFQSHSAPAPSSNQIRELQQQFPPPSQSQEQGYQVKALGDGNRNSAKWRKQQQKKSKNQHFTKMSDINEDTVKKIDPTKIKMNIQSIENEEQAQVKAPPKRSRNSLADKQRLDSLAKPRAKSLAAPGSPVAPDQSYGGLAAPKFRKKRKAKDDSVNADEYSDSEERAKISSWDARRSSVLAADVGQEKEDPFRGRRKSVFDESSSDEEDEVNNWNGGGRRLTVDLHNAPNQAVSGHMGNLGNYK